VVSKPYNFPATECFVTRWITTGLSAIALWPVVVDLGGSVVNKLNMYFVAEKLYIGYGGILIYCIGSVML